MATFGQYWSIPGLAATGSLASYQYYIVMAGSTAATVKVATTPATDDVLGVLQNDPASGEAAVVAFAGIAKVAAETGITYGNRVTCSSTGRAKATDTDGHRIVGVALESSSTAGDIIRVALSISDRYKA